MRFFPLLFLCMGVINSSATILNPSGLRSDIPADSFSYYQKIAVCFFTFDKCDCDNYVLEECDQQCGGFFVDAKLENQSCSPTPEDEKTLCISRYRIIAEKCNIHNAIKETFGEYIEIKEHLVPHRYQHWTTTIFISGIKNQVRVYKKFCREENCR